MKWIIYGVVLVFGVTVGHVYAPKPSSKSNSIDARSLKASLDQTLRAYWLLQYKLSMCEHKYVCSAKPSSALTMWVECISYTQVCDGVHDCTDGVDELNCPTPAPPPFMCGPGQYRCQLVDQCINSTYVCDGTPNCPLGEDESHCPGSCFCPANSYICQGSQQCIPQSRVCDGLIVDCPNGDDEFAGCMCNFGTTPDFCAAAGTGNELDLVNVIAVNPLNSNLAACQEFCRVTEGCQAIIVEADDIVQCALVNTAIATSLMTSFTPYAPGAACDIQFYVANCN